MKDTSLAATISSGVEQTTSRICSIKQNPTTAECIKLWMSYDVLNFISYTAGKIHQRATDSLNGV